MHFCIYYILILPIYQVHSFAKQFRRTPQKFIHQKLFRARDFLKHTNLKGKKSCATNQWLIVVETLC